jgi:hypothetical protein
LTTLVLLDNFRIFIELTTFWLLANFISTFIWPTKEFFTALINLVADKMLVETTDWDFWAVEIKALDIVLLATRTDSTRVSISIPRFPEDPWAFVIIDTWWFVWSGGSGSWLS